MLIRLLLSANRVVSVDELIDSLWGENELRAPVKSLQMQLTYLRRSLGTGASAGLLVTEAGGYSLRISDEALDTWSFEGLVRDGRRSLADGLPELAREYLHTGLSLWRGKALVDVEDEPFARSEISRLAQLRLAALEERFEADLATGTPEEVISELETFVEENGLRERAWGQLMLAHYRCGRQADALRAYQRASAQLSDIGIKPTRELRDLERAILAQDLRLERRSTPTTARNIPVRHRPEPFQDTAFPLPPAAHARGGVYGRRDALATVRAAWERSLSAGERQVVLVEGDPGIGKTRFAAEVAAQLHGRGGNVVWGRCEENATNPYQPFSEALSHLFRHASDTAVKALAGHNAPYLVHVVPMLTERFGNVGEAQSSGSDQDRFLVFDAVASVLSRTAENGPLLLVIDDLHWASQPAVLLLRHWLSQSSSEATMLVATYRPTEPGTGRHVRPLLADLGCDADALTLVLDDLKVEDLEELVHEIGPAGSVEQPVQLARALYRHTSGNPLLFTQMLRHLMETGPGRGADLLADGRIPDEGDRLPGSIRHLVRARLDRLDDEVVRLLQVAAVVGTELDLAVVERLLAPTENAAGPEHGPSSLAILEAAEAATAARLLDEVVDGRGFRFVHGLVRDSIYEDLSMTRRVRMHHRVADALAELGRPAPMVAHHYCYAVPDGARDAAIHWLEKAALQHKAAYAYEDARQVLELALAHLNESSEVDLLVRSRLALALARCADMTGDEETSKKSAELAAADAKRCGAIEMLAYAAMQRAGHAQPDMFDQLAEDLLEEALELVGDNRPDLKALLLSHAALGKDITYGRTHSTDALAQTAIVVARDANEVKALYAVLASCLLMQMVQLTPNVMETRSLLMQMSEIERSGTIDFDAPDGPFDMPFSALTKRRSRYEALLCLRVADLDGFDRTLAEIEQQGAVRRDWVLQTMAACLRAMRALFTGHFAEAAAQIDEATRLGGHDVVTRNVLLGIRFKLARELGRLSELEAVITNATARPAHLSLVRSSQALLYAEIGRVEEAYRIAEDFIPGQLDDLTYPIPASTAAAFAEVYCDAHDTKRVAQFYEHLLPYAGQMLVVTWTLTVTGAADRFLGMLASELHRWDEADERFAAALELERALQAPPLLARTSARWAQSLIRRGSTHDTRRGLDLLETSAAQARQLGMKQLETFIETLERDGRARSSESRAV